MSRLRQIKHRWLCWRGRHWWHGGYVGAGTHAKRWLTCSRCGIPCDHYGEWIHPVEPGEAAS